MFICIYSSRKQIVYYTALGALRRMRVRDIAYSFYSKLTDRRRCRRRHRRDLVRIGPRLWLPGGSSIDVRIAYNDDLAPATTSPLRAWT